MGTSISPGTECSIVVIWTHCVMNVVTNQGKVTMKRVEHVVHTTIAWGGESAPNMTN